MCFHWNQGVFSQQQLWSAASIWRDVRLIWVHGGEAKRKPLDPDKVPKQDMWGSCFDINKRRSGRHFEATVTIFRPSLSPPARMGHEASALSSLGSPTCDLQYTAFMQRTSTAAFIPPPPSPSLPDFSLPPTVPWKPICSCWEGLHHDWFTIRPWLSDQLQDNGK